MAPLPKKKHSRERQGKRRAAISLALPVLVQCKNCKSMITSHQICKTCGTYAGKVIVAKTNKVKVTKEQNA